ncbi:MAG TPA: putative toxin-antitoxin system toxin component, PIN family [Candidatus Sulfotelmatobacter sp.]|jgi:putative PIN family toxin of toxin-antitoxin system
MIALRLVLDTNILVSAALKPDGLQRAILTLALTRPARLYVTDAVVAEYKEVLARPEFKIKRGIRLQFMQLIKDRGRLVRAVRVLQEAQDPSDDKFLECADAAHADYLITGNLRHFPRFWKSTKVVTTREFIGIVAPHFGR